MLSNRLLSLETRVWTAAFGNEMATGFANAACEVGCHAAAAANGGDHGRTAAYRCTSGCCGLSTAFRLPSDVWAYLLAFSPLLFIVLDIVFYDPLSPAPGGKASLLGAWLIMVLAWGDARNLGRSRRNPQWRVILPFMLLTPVGYFWRRWAIIRTSIKFLWIWLACFVAYVVTIAGLSPS